MVEYKVDYLLFSEKFKMKKSGNVEDMTEKFDEIKGLIEEVKDTMMSSEDCNNQFYSVLQSLDGISENLTKLENEKSKPTDEYTILQTNILEVKKELSNINNNIEEKTGANLHDAIVKLSEKLDSLNTGSSESIDSGSLSGITLGIENSVKSALDGAVHNSTDIINSNLEKCAEYLENAIKTTSNASTQSLSDDMTLLGTTLEKTSDNLKRSIIDIFTRIQEEIENSKTTDSHPQAAKTEHVSESKGNAKYDADLDKDIEMLKNGIYNLNANSEQRLSKLNNTLSELDLFKNLEKFAKIKDLPAIGDLKHNLQSNIDRIVDKYSYTLQSSQNRNELMEVTQQFRNDVFNEIINMLGNASEFILDDDSLLSKDSEKAQSPIEMIQDKLEDLTHATSLNNGGIDSLAGSLNNLKDDLLDLKQQSENISSDLKDNSIKSLKSDIHDLYVNGESLKLQNKEMFDRLNEYPETLKAISDKVGELSKYPKELEEHSEKIIESSAPDRKAIKDLLKDIKKNISILQSGDEEAEYTYSMQDIESDIAKIRLYLNDLRKNGVTVDSREFTDELNKVVVSVDLMTKQLNKIDESNLSDILPKMKSDLTSVSTRVNKLLLTSDNSYNMLEDALKEFRGQNKSILSEIRKIVDEDKFKAIENGVTALKLALSETNSYNKTINQSLLMLAEWVDSAGETLTDIHDNQSKLQALEEIKAGVNNVTLSMSQNSENIVSSVKDLLTENIPEQIDYTDILTGLNDKVKEQAAVIQRQDERISKLDEKLTTILEISAKNDYSALTDKISNIDTQMAKLNRSIEKLTAYVNED